ncbi:MAG: hypothetical protein Fur003_2790 [Candidatus Dojkabacteria bacterium]
MKKVVQKVKESGVLAQLKENMHRNTYIVMMMMLIIGILVAVIVRLIWDR